MRSLKDPISGANPADEGSGDGKASGSPMSTSSYAPATWRKAHQDRLCVACASLLAGFSAFRLLVRGVYQTAEAHSYLGTISYVAGFLIGAVVILSLLPSPWVQPTYGVETLNDFESELLLAGSDVPLNKVQVIGTHNSVHVAGLFSMFIPYWQYTHPTLISQLNVGIRHIELDLWFNKSLGVWEVWHECVDRLTVTPLFLKDTLSQLLSWSKSNQGHFPLTINLDIKGAYYSYTSYLTPWLLGRGFGGTKRDRYIFQMLEREVLAAWPIPMLFTPSEMLLRSSKKTLKEAIASMGWPSVNQLKSRTLFQLNLNEGRAGLAKIIPSTVFFKRGHDFLNPEPDAAWFETNDHAVISSLTERGYFTRVLDPFNKGFSENCQYVATNNPSRYPQKVLEDISGNTEMGSTFKLNEKTSLPKVSSEKSDVYSLFEVKIH